MDKIKCILLTITLSLAPVVYYGNWSKNDTALALATVGIYINYKVFQSFKNDMLVDAAKDGNTSVVKALLALGADPNYKYDDWYGTALQTAFKYNKSCKIMEILLCHGADPHCVDKDGETLLHKYNHWTEALPEKAELLLKYGANPNAKAKVGRLGSGPLYALNCGYFPDYLKFARVLLRYGADPTPNEYTSKSLLYFAYRGADVDLFNKLLFAYHLDPNQWIIDMPTKNGKIPICTILCLLTNKELGKETWKDVPDIDDKRILMIEALLKGGADPCRGNGYVELIESPDLQEKIVPRYTPLHFAAAGNDLKVVQLLLFYAPNPQKLCSQKDHEGKLPIDYAIRYEVKRLLSNPYQNPEYIKTRTKWLETNIGTPTMVLRDREMMGKRKKIKLVYPKPKLFDKDFLKSCFFQDNYSKQVYLGLLNGNLIILPSTINTP